MSAILPKLSEGSLSQMLSDQRVDRPVLQIIVYKQMTQSEPIKYRFQMTDGTEVCSNFIVILPELIQRISRGEFEKFTVVELTAYTLNINKQMERQVCLTSTPLRV